MIPSVKGYQMTFHSFILAFIAKQRPYSLLLHCRGYYYYYYYYCCYYYYSYCCCCCCCYYYYYYYYYCWNCCNCWSCCWTTHPVVLLQDQTGLSVLGACTEKGRCQEELVALLLSTGIEVNKTNNAPLCDAVTGRAYSRLIINICDTIWFNILCQGTYGEVAGLKPICSAKDIVARDFLLWIKSTVFFLLCKHLGANMYTFGKGCLICKQQRWRTIRRPWSKLYWRMELPQTQ